ncbi:heterokaryon incompatibility protein-domain-containing protein, partial [Ilyonectria sp. MPI-CAGE-AT-0026]
DDPPPYEAVSYTWDPDPTEHLPVAINGMQHLVPRNVHDILSRLGSTFSRRYIWIDSICINQSDEAEKVHQIKLMRHVYHRAFRVLACLGESRKTGYAAALLNMLVIWKWKFGTVGAARQTLVLLQNRRSNHFLEANLTGFFELLDHRWFERAWVVQEVIFARQLTLHQRNYTWIWEYFLEAVEVLIDPSV